MRSEVNHVYGTYEVSADPVAEVTASLLFETHFFIFNWTFFSSQAIDHNLDYGAVYGGNEITKTTDVNEDYDYMSS